MSDSSGAGGGRRDSENDAENTIGSGMLVVAVVNRNAARFSPLIALLCGCSHASPPPVQRTREPSAFTTPTKPRRVLPSDPPGDPPQAVPPTLLEGLRIAGTKDVVPDEKTRAQMASDGSKSVIGSFKLCIDETGDLSAVETLRSTGYRAYDEEILNAIDVWRYEPYRVLDRAVPVCTAVTLIYRPVGPGATRGDEGHELRR